MYRVFIAKSDRKAGYRGKKRSNVGKKALTLDFWLNLCIKGNKGSVAGNG